MENKFTTLLDVMPNLEFTKSDGMKAVRGVQEFLQEHGRNACSADEVAFISLLERYIDIFTKAKSMIAKDRFTVEYKGEQNSSSISLTDFEIIPIVKKSDG